MTPNASVRKIAATDTHALRRLVLRDGAVDAVVDWPGDDEPTTTHLGVSIDGRVVAISTWLVAPDPTAPNLESVQLRGMATDPSAVGGGLGSALLTAGVQRAKLARYERVWANARVTALGFYEGAGWIPTGPVFETPMTGLPHRHVHLDIE